jgi:hypothetical protein
MSVLHASRLLKLDNNQDSQGRHVYSVDCRGVGNYNHMIFLLADGDRSYETTHCVKNWNKFMIMSAKKSRNDRYSDFYVLDKATVEVFSYLNSARGIKVKLSEIDDEISRLS